MELYTQFRTRQLQRRDWIQFTEIAKWIAGEKGAVRIKDKHLTDAYRALLSGLRLGEFDHEGRCTVHYLNFEKNEKEYDARLAGQWLVDLVDEFLKVGADFRKVVVPAYLVACWVPRNVILDWCNNNKLDPRPNWLEAREPDAPAEDSAIAVSPSGRKARKRNVAKDAVKRAQYAHIKSTLDRLVRKHPGHSKTAIRQILIEQGKHEGLADSTLKQIQSGTYQAMKNVNKPKR